MANKTITVHWTGRYPTLCYGEWKIIIDGICLTGIEDSPFKTIGDYQSWHFEEDYSEVFEDYEDGESFSIGWLETNGLQDSLNRHGIILTEEEQIDLYDKIQSEDWRHNSCGGCI